MSDEVYNMIPGLLLLIKSEEGIFANVSSSIRNPKLTLLCGKLAIPFEKCASPFGEASHFGTSSIGESFIPEAPSEAAPRSVFSCWINQFEDWCLAEKETIQLCIHGRDRSHELKYAQTVKIDQGKDALSFRAKIATHRAKASLDVTFRNLDTRKEATKSVPFDDHYSGGKTPEKYQDVDIPLPAEKGRYEVGFSVTYISNLEPKNEHDPFVFLADVRVESSSSMKSVEVLEGDVAKAQGLWLRAALADDADFDGFVRIGYAGRKYSFLSSDLKRTWDYFDEDFYIDSNPDVDFGTINPFEHYSLHGWREGRSPNPEFNIREYLLRHPDVEIMDIDPLLHYAREGQKAGRSLGVFNEILRGMWATSGRKMPEGSESDILARAQDFMVPMEMIDTRRLIVLVAPEHNAMSGGIYSIFSIADHIRRTRHVHGYDVIVMTRPNPQNLTYLRNSAFRNHETVYRFEQLRLFRSVEDLQLHIPEYATVEFVRSLSSDMLHYLLRRDNVHINILNQNTRLMPEADKFRDIRRIANSIGQSVAHHAYAGQEFADQYGLPTLLLPAWTDLTPYPGSQFEDKENLIIYSDDEAPYRTEVLKRLRGMGDYRLVKILGMTFDRYMELATRCRFSITFGEGFDGYVAQPIYQGGIGFALYTDEFFPSDRFKKYENFFLSEEELIEGIVPTIRRLEADKKRYVALNTALRKEWDALYNYDDYVARIAKLVAKEYEVFPGGKPGSAGSQSMSLKSGSRS